MIDIQKRLLEISKDGELWKPCPEFEDKYLISSYGRVLGIGTYNTCKKGELIKQHKKRGRNGYMQVRLYNNGIAKTIEVHTLVAKAFIPNPQSLPMINHIDEDKTNNHVNNLEWCTNQYNVRYSNAKRVDIYTKDGTFIETLNSLTDASKKYNIPTSNISRCCLSKNGICYGYQFRFYKHPFVPKPFTEYKRRLSRKGHKSNEDRYVSLREYTTDGSYITTWSNSEEAAKAYNIAGSNIRKCSRGEINTTGGKIFLRDNENIEDRLIKIHKKV